MASGWKSVFKRQTASTPNPSISVTVVENTDESSAIMHEMQELATADIILGPMANSTDKLPSVLSQNSLSDVELRDTPGTSENKTSKNRKRFKNFFFFLILDRNFENRDRQA